HGVVPERQLALGHDQALDRVAVEVGVLVDRHRGLGRPGFGDQLVAGVRTWSDLDRGDSRSAHVVPELAADPEIDRFCRLRDGADTIAVDFVTLDANYQF